jgi:hypothetical protein
MSDQSDALNKLARERGIIPDIPQPVELPHVPLPRAGEQLINFARSVGAIVGANGLFRRESVPVTIDPESGRIEPMDPDRFRTYVESQLLPYVERGTQYGRVKLPATMSGAEARGCLRADAFRAPLRKLQRVHQVRLPIIRSDGHIELLPKGYDAESGIFTMKDCLEYDPDWALDRARFFLNELLGEFPFADERSRAAHVTAMVALFASTLLPANAKRLAWLYRANASRSGKGLLASTAICGPWGAATVQSIPGDNDEFRKILDTEALNGSAYILFDEVERKLRNRALNAFLTANVWTGRLMNSQQKFTVPQTSIVLMTGNNVDLSSDLAGRCILVDLFVEESDAQARHIKRVIDEAWLVRREVRADLLSAMWALVRHWNESRRRGASTLYRGFETFSRIVGGIVEHAGFGNPLKSTAAEVDPDYADMLAIVERLATGVHARAEFEFQELIDVCRELNAFEWQLIGTFVREDMIDRFELTAKAKSIFGKLFAQQYGGTIFTLRNGRRVRFGKRGDNRQRRYTIEVVGGGNRA